MKAFILHTVRPGLDMFEGLLKKHYPQVAAWNILDDFWIKGTGAHGGVFTRDCHIHLLNMCEAMEHAGADIIICTCSSLTPHFERIRPYIRVPIVAIDATMASRSIEKGSDILIFATAETAIESADMQIRAAAAAKGAQCRITPVCSDEAGRIMRGGGDMAEHDRIVLSLAEGMKGHDVIVLTQLSTSHLAPEIERITGTKTLTTPMLCIEDLANYIH